MPNLRLTPEQEELLGSWRVWALTKMPYFAPILFNLRPLNSPGLGTFACDERMRLYIDFEEVESWGTHACAEVLLHEAGHVWGQHAAFARDWNIGPEHHRTWNAAADASINDDLAEAGCTYIAKTGILPSQFGEPDHETPRYYFDALSKQMRQAAGQQQPSRGKDSGQSQGEGGSGQPDPGGQNGQAGEQDSSQGSGEPFEGCGSVSGGEAAPYEIGDDGDDLGVSGASALQVEAVRAATAQAITTHVASGRGTVPGSLVQQASTFFDPPKVPWQRVLSAYVRKYIRLAAGEEVTDYYRRDRRRHNVTLGSKKVLFPGTGKPVVPLAVVRDTSGSMSKAELDRATAEIIGIAKAMHIRGRDLHILDVDAHVHTVKGYNGPRDLAEVTGRGGTDMAVGIERALQLRPSPAAVVVLSDGGTPWPEARTRTPVVAALVGPHAASAARNVPSLIKTVVVDG